jgi:hypothetical protein
MSQASKVTEELSNFIISLCEDPKKQQTFRTNPQAVIQAAKLSPDAQALLDMRYRPPSGGPLGEGEATVVVIVIVIVVAITRGPIEPIAQ